jgi:hypothetical protein
MAAQIGNDPPARFFLRNNITDTLPDSSGSAQTMEQDIGRLSFAALIGIYFWTLALSH